MRVVSIAVVAVGLVLRALTVRAENVPPPWEITLGTAIGGPSGFVKVGEHDQSGDLLHLHATSASRRSRPCRLVRRIT